MCLAVECSSSSCSAGLSDVAQAEKVIAKTTARIEFRRIRRDPGAPTINLGKYIFIYDDALAPAALNGIRARLRGSRSNKNAIRDQPSHGRGFVIRQLGAFTTAGEVEVENRIGSGLADLDMKSRPKALSEM